MLAANYTAAMTEAIPARVLEAEYRREFRELLAKSSVGGPSPDPCDPVFVAEVLACMEAYKDTWPDMDEEHED